MQRTFWQAGFALLLLAAAGCRDEGPTASAPADARTALNAAAVLDWTVYSYVSPPPSPEWAEAFALPTGELYVVGFAAKLAVQKDGVFQSIPLVRDWKLADVWASSPTNVMVVGTTGRDARAAVWNGTTFTDMPVPYRVPGLTAVWGFAPNDAYAVGGPNVLHWNGSAWTVVFTTGLTSFYGVWGSGPNDVFAVGTGGVIFHFNGTSWQQQPSGTTQKLDAVWGFSPTDVHAVGDNGVALHYNGTAWSSAGTLAATMQGLWGSAPDDLWAVGKLGWTAHFDGTSWTSIKTVAKGDLWGVAGRSPSDVHAVGSSYLLYDGTSWKPFPTPITINAQWGFTNSLAFAVTSAGTILRFNGTGWSTMPSPMVGALYDIWGSSASDLYAVGVNGNLLHYDGVAWSKVPSGTSVTLYGIWGYRGTIYAVGASGTILRNTGGGWMPMASGTAATLYDVHGTSNGRVFAAGTDGLHHWDGTSWSLMTSPCCLNAVWSTPGAVFSVGDGGRVWRRTTTGVLTILPGAPTLKGVWGTGPNDVFAVGANSTISHWDGVSWTPVAPPAGVSSTFTSAWIWGTSPTEVFVTGSNTALLRGHR